MTIKTLLSVHEGDFELWEEEKYGSTYYSVGIEGYIGFDKLEHFVSMYKTFLEELEGFLTENNYPKPDRYSWKVVYQQRAMEICYESDFYWIFLDSYESTSIWDTYYYLQDVIHQLSDVKIDKDTLE